MPQKPQGRLFDSILDTIGGTPLVRINRLIPRDQARVYAKCEFFSVGGSTKDRIAVSMLRAAERACTIDKDCVIIEPTTGNTGIALAIACAAKGFRLILTMPDTMSLERRRLLKHLGAELILTPAEEGMGGAIREAKRLVAEIDRSYMPGQFSNMENPRIHAETTAEEIWEDTQGAVDIFIAGVGTGGTLSGVASTLKARKPSFQAIAVEPSSLPAIRKHREGHRVEPGTHKIQGIGPGYVPETLQVDLIDEVVGVDDDEAFEWARRLAREEGIPGGVSAGANLCAAAKVAARSENRDKMIVTVIPSAAERYLSTPLFETGLEALGDAQEPPARP